MLGYRGVVSGGRGQAAPQQQHIISNAHITNTQHASNNSHHAIHHRGQYSQQTQKFGGTGDDRIRRLIIEIGDKVNEIPNQIRALAKLFYNQITFYDKHEEIFLTTIIQAATAMSVKIGIYGTVCGIINKNMMMTHNKQVGSKLCEKINYEMEVHLKRANCLHANNLLRLIVALSGANLLNQESVLHFLRFFLIKAKDYDNEKCYIAADNILFILLSSLPWISRFQFFYFKEFIEECVSYAEDYRKRIKHYSEKYKNLIEGIKSEEDSAIHPDRLDLLIEAIKLMKNKEWEGKAVFRFYQSKLLLDDLNMQVGEVTKDNESDLGNSRGSGNTNCLVANNPNYLCDIPLCIFPHDEFKAKCSPIKSYISFKNFPFVSATKNVPPLSLSDQWILEEHIILMIYFFNASLKCNAEQILRIPLLHEDFECIATQVIFSTVLNLPKIYLIESTLDCNIFYFRLLDVICRMQKTFDNAVEKVYLYLLEKIDYFDEEFFQIVTDFLSYWINSMDYSFNFKVVLDSDENVNPKYVRFLSVLCDKSLRLTFPDNLTKRLPSYVHKYIPPQSSFKCEIAEQRCPEFEHILDCLKYNFDVDEDEYASRLDIAKYVVNLIGHEKQQHRDELVPSAEKIENNIEADRESIKEIWDYESVIYILTQAIFYRGSKTLSHMNRILDNYSNVLFLISPKNLNKGELRNDLDISVNDDSFYCVVINSIYILWKNFSQRFNLSIQGLLVRNVMKHHCVFVFLFSYLPTEELIKLNAWELCEIVMNDILQKKKGCENEYLRHHRLKDKNESDMEQLKMNIDSANQVIRETLCNLLTILVKKHEACVDEPGYQNYIYSLTLAIGRKYIIFMDLTDILSEVGNIVENSSKMSNMFACFTEFLNSYYPNLNSGNVN